MERKVFEIASLSGGINVILLEIHGDITSGQFNDLCREISEGLHNESSVDKIANILIEKHNFQKVVPDGKFILL